MERVAGIEPAYSAWKAAALPLSYTRPEAKPPAPISANRGWLARATPSRFPQFACRTKFLRNLQARVLTLMRQPTINRPDDTQVLVVSYPEMWRGGRVVKSIRL